MEKRRYLLAYAGVSGTGHVAEFSDQGSLDRYAKECDECSQITVSMLRPTEYSHDRYEYIGTYPDLRQKDLRG